MCLKYGWAGVLACLILNGCASFDPPRANLYDAQPKRAELELMLSRLAPKDDLQKAAKVGLAELNRGNFEAAGETFRAGLRLEPGNGHLHFLNALAYHLQGRAGEMKMLDLARTGYQTALRYDESNSMAAYLLGQIYFHEKNYAAAKRYFSYGLSYAPDSTYLLNALSAAAYYDRDLDTAGHASRKAYSLSPRDAGSIKNLMFADAANGYFDDIPRLTREYEAAVRGQRMADDVFGVNLKIEQTVNRIQDWKKFHLAAAGDIFDTPSSDIVTYSTGDAQRDESAGPSNDGDSPRSVDSATSTRATRHETAVAGRASGRGKDLPKMTHIDVVIIRTEETRSQSKGINLLDGLKATLSGDFSYSYSRASGTTTRKTSFSPTLALAAIDYNLNIFNDQGNKAEILARPSLLATEHVTSQFFSGGVLHVQLSSNNYDGGMEDINIGTSLSVTPEFVDAETLAIDVKADHEYLEAQNENVGYDAYSQTTKTSVQARAVLKFDETLILSGLSEREADTSQSGVPVLQDVPGLQYLFSRNESSQTKKSILILLTPHKPRYASETLTEEQIDRQADLEKIHLGRLKTIEKNRNTNINAVMAHLGRDSLFYRQFRTGDLDLKFFEDDDSVFGAIKRTLGFLYF